MHVRRIGTIGVVAALASGIFACGGDAEEGAATTEGQEASPAAEGPDTLPESVRAPEMEGGYLIVDPARVREWQESGEAFVLVDARDPVQFEQEHLPGAVNVPYVDIRAGSDLPPRDARVVVYCSDANCPISQYAYDALERLGYANLYDMREGLQGWKAEGYPTVIGEAIEPADTSAAPAG